MRKTTPIPRKPRSFTLRAARGPYVAQVAHGGCGIACADMVLGAVAAAHPWSGGLRLGLGRPKSLEPRLWHLAPDALARLLNDALRPVPGVAYGVEAWSDREVLHERMAASMESTRLPVVALVLGRSHWVVVEGFTAADTVARGRVIAHWIVRDPCEGPSRFHGTRSARDPMGVFGGRISMSLWRLRYAKGVPASSPTWSGLHVAVCPRNVARPA